MKLPVVETAPSAHISSLTVAMGDANLSPAYQQLKSPSERVAAPHLLRLSELATMINNDNIFIDNENLHKLNTVHN